MSTDNARIIHRIAYNDPNMIAEIRRDKMSKRRWVTLWINRDDKWSEYELNNDSLHLLESMLSQCRKILRQPEK